MADIQAILQRWVNGSISSIYEISGDISSDYQKLADEVQIVNQELSLTIEGPDLSINIYEEDDIDT